ncbi:MAG: hypothetical protein ACI9O5_000049 [Algoriphagus sp.]|jgi:hypothetical protein
MRIIIVLFLFLASNTILIAQNFDSAFLGPKAIREIKADKFEELSGIAFSRVHAGVFYGHTDSGGKSSIYIFNADGEELGEIKLEKVANRDWEDIAVGPGPGGNSYIYIGEIGDNAAVHDEIFIYRIPEPTKLTPESEVKPEKIKLTYPGGARDAETLMVDPISGDIYIISKRDKNNNIYCLPAARFNEKEAELGKVGELNFTSSVAGDISSDGNQILIKSYLNIYYWTRKAGESIEQALSREPLMLIYNPEPQGEAIGFQPDGKAYYTISEKRFDINPTLYRYEARN